MQLKKRCLFCKTFERLDNMMCGFHCKKIYIDILRWVDSWLEQETQKDQNDKPNIQVMLTALQTGEYNYEQDTIQASLRHLIDSGYLQQMRATSNIVTTESGKQFLCDYSKFQMLGALAKFTELFKTHFVAIVSLLALVISVVSLVKKCKT